VFVDRNYHVFYYLLAGCSESEKDTLLLTRAQDYFYLNQVLLHYDVHVNIVSLTDFRPNIGGSVKNFFYTDSSLLLSLMSLVQVVTFISLIFGHPSVLESGSVARAISFSAFSGYNQRMLSSSADSCQHQLFPVVLLAAECS